MMHGHGPLGRMAVCLFCLLAGFWGGAPVRAESLPVDIAAQIPAPVTSPNRFGLSGDDAWLGAGQKMVAVKPRKRVVEITAPGTLDQPHTEYKLMNDVEADGTAFRIVKNNITLNLNGHTVTYGRNPTEEQAYGVCFTDQWTFEDVAVLNGAIIQAEPYADGALGKKWGLPYGSGFCPIYGMSLKGAEFAGLHLVYGGKDLSGIFAKGRLHIHHNTIEDRGHGVTNRHRGLAAIEGGSNGMRAHNNLILRARHNGIRAGKNCEIHRNIVFIDSEATNSAGIAAGGEIRENKIVAKGVHPLGFYLGGDVVGEGAKYVGNYVIAQNTRHSVEYGSAGAACLRLQWGDDIHVADNVFILQAENRADGFKSWGRALMVSLSEAGRKALFENNLIVAMGKDGMGKAAGIAVVANNQSSDLVFRNNIVVSTWADVLLADSYGHADGFPRFEDNTFMRAVHAPEFVTIRSQYSERPSTGVFVGTRFSGGASFEDVDLEFGGTGLKEIAVAARLEVAVAGEDGRPVAQAAVSIADVEGAEVFSGTTDDRGRVVAEIVQYRLTNRDKGKLNRIVGRLSGRDSWLSPHTPHEVTASSNGRAARARVEVDGDSRLDLTLR
ncbi:hypothetical protein dsat_1300 [Alkalidesulfovibrio alkalitolerans DSM 16529]|uniref:Right handed beta helix domain-containing protein n=2 Tax=Alkalidesulfovibrio alkalitolerans TaxID=293256 RepID=S7UEB8_9BACT|nr:hypothetical protein dsat_1300 [Alkalidesulfovibrio alkalitolerans DSM 16529]